MFLILTPSNNKDSGSDLKMNRIRRNMASENDAYKFRRKKTLEAFKAKSKDDRTKFLNENITRLKNMMSKYDIGIADIASGAFLITVMNKITQNTALDSTAKEAEKKEILKLDYFFEMLVSYFLAADELYLAVEKEEADKNIAYVSFKDKKAQKTSIISLPIKLGETYQVLKDMMFQKTAPNSVTLLSSAWGQAGTDLEAFSKTLMSFFRFYNFPKESSYVYDFEKSEENEAMLLTEIYGNKDVLAKIYKKKYCQIMGAFTQ